jgi:hypothetical protein
MANFLMTAMNGSDHGVVDIKMHVSANVGNTTSDGLDTNARQGQGNGGVWPRAFNVDVGNVLVARGNVW